MAGVPIVIVSEGLSSNDQNRVAITMLLMNLLQNNAIDPDGGAYALLLAIAAGKKKIVESAQ